MFKHVQPFHRTSLATYLLPSNIRCLNTYLSYQTCLSTYPPPFHIQARTIFHRKCSSTYPLKPLINRTCLSTYIPSIEHIWARTPFHQTWSGTYSPYRTCVGTYLPPFHIQARTLPHRTCLGDVPPAIKHVRPRIPPSKIHSRTLASRHGKLKPDALL